jgi:hypothetical protein
LLLAAGASACGDDDDNETSAAASTTTTAAAGASEFAEYIGLTVAAAGAKAESDDRVWRVIEIDGEPQKATMDLNPDRLNFVVVDDKVTKVTTG